MIINNTDSYNNISNNDAVFKHAVGVCFTRGYVPQPRYLSE